MSRQLQGEIFEPSSVTELFETLYPRLNLFKVDDQKNLQVVNLLQ